MTNDERAKLLNLIDDMRRTADLLWKLTKFGAADMLREDAKALEKLLGPVGSRL